jgi:hypothetical protein
VGGRDRDEVRLTDPKEWRVLIKVSDCLLFVMVLAVDAGGLAIASFHMPESFVDSQGPIRSGPIFVDAVVVVPVFVGGPAGPFLEVGTTDEARRTRCVVGLVEDGGAEDGHHGDGCAFLGHAAATGVPSPSLDGLLNATGDWVLEGAFDAGCWAPRLTVVLTGGCAAGAPVNGALDPDGLFDDAGPAVGGASVGTLLLLSAGLSPSGLVDGI